MTRQERGPGASGPFPTTRPTRLFHLASPDLYSFIRKQYSSKYIASRSSVCHSSKSMETKWGWLLEPGSIASLSEALVTTWTGVWHLKYCECGSSVRVKEKHKQKTKVFFFFFEIEGEQ